MGVRLGTRVLRWERWLGILLIVAWAGFILLVGKSWFFTPAKSVSPIAASEASRTNSRVADVTPEKITVYVIGEVKRPGLYRLPLDARLVSAIRLAGGATPQADLAAINLAAVAEDGTEIVVPAKNESLIVQPVTPVANSSAHKSIPSGVTIQLNQATLSTLESLPGIGAKKAQAILDFRKAHGLFFSINELSQVKGIGPKLLAKIQPYLSLR